MGIHARLHTSDVIVTTKLRQFFDTVEVFGLPSRVLWSGIGVKIKVAFHCTGLAFYAVLFEFNVASVAFSCSVAK